MTHTLDSVFKEIRSCAVCRTAKNPLQHAPRPIIRGTPRSRIRIIGQAPGTRVHASGIPFDDPSGDRLRDWLGVTRQQFYDEDYFAITPMGFCFPGLDGKGGDLPPRKECAPLWQEKIDPLFANVELTLLVGQYAQKHVLGKWRRNNLTETVRHWQEYTPEFLPLPHPSWRNNVWIQKNQWFEEPLAYLKLRIEELRP